MHPYVVEDFSDEERAFLSRFVTNTDQPVFGLVNLPEVVKGALFARYSRSTKSLRRLLLDEFREDLVGLDVDTDRVAAERAEKLYARVFDEFGDDSVAQLGGAHVAVEQASNLLTKVLERGRLGAYLEQSTRYMRYDDKPGGRYRYYRDPEVMASPLAARYEADLDAVFDGYHDLFEPVLAWARERFPQDDTTSDAVYRNTLNAKACDVLRGLLPAATVSNVGIFASGQAYENLLLRMRSHELAEARDIGDRLLKELRQVIPSFLVRVDRPDRGGVWSDYLRGMRDETRAVAQELLAGEHADDAAEVTLVDWDDDAEQDVLVGMLYASSDLPETQLRWAVEKMNAEERLRLVRAYVGERRNRRHKPGRALERAFYRFDVLGDYGAFRDLQRHRMLTIEWQELTCLHGYETPPEIIEAGVEDDWHAIMQRQAELWQALRTDFPRQAQYAVGFAWKLRYSMQLNARAAMQMLELRTTPQGHPTYRRVAQEMHRQISEVAGHHAIAEMMSFVDYGAADLERLEAEKAGEAKRAAREQG